MHVSAVALNVNLGKTDCMADITAKGNLIGRKTKELMVFIQALMSMPTMSLVIILIYSVDPDERSVVASSSNYEAFECKRPHDAQIKPL